MNHLESQPISRGERLAWRMAVVCLTAIGVWEWLVVIAAVGYGMKARTGHSLIDTSLSTDASLDAWQEYAPVAAGFSVQLPRSPIEFTHEADTGSYKLLEQHARALIGNESYGVMYVHLPTPPHALRDEANEVLDALRDAFVAKSYARLITENQIEKAGHPGRDLVAETQVTRQDAARIYCRLFLVDNRVYQLTAMGPLGTIPYDSVSKFFDSFRLR